MNRRRFLRQGIGCAGSLAGGVALAGCARLAASRRNHGATLNGIDVVEQQEFAPLKNLRLGLITNHTGQNRLRQPTIDLLARAPGVRLVTLFSPEHGIRGEADEKINDSTDQKTGLPVYSLYGERRTPTAKQLQGLDALVYDIQDIGCRFYTYPSTMGFCLEAAARAKLKFFVLDRVNPINGIATEGPVYQGKRLFTAFHHVPLRHGMTVGELARLFNDEQRLGADLHVIPASGWRRREWFDATDLPWTNPSPNMRSLMAATLYPGLGLHESALSVGRGTDKPFEIAGAPYIDELRLASELRTARLPGITFVPIRFTPSYSTFKDKPCAGVAFVVVDREQFNAVDLGITLALTLQRLWPNAFALSKMSGLLQDPATIDAIRSGQSLASITRTWADNLAGFRQKRRTFLLY